MDQPRLFITGHSGMSYRTETEIIAAQIGTITALAGGAIAVCRAPFAGIVTGMSVVVNGAFTVTDIVATGRINTTNITSGAVTVPTSGSAFGSTATATPSGANTFAVGDILGCTITGGVGTVSGAVLFVLSRT